MDEGAGRWRGAPRTAPFRARFAHVFDITATTSAQRRMSEGSGWLEQVGVGALASGVNKPTAVLLLGCCAALLLPQFALLTVALRKGVAVGHCCVLLALTFGLLGGCAWCGSALPSRRSTSSPASRFLTQVGLVDFASQSKELFGEAEAAPATADADAPAPQEKTKKEQ